MSNSKKIRNRLDQLFTGINEPEVEEGLPAETKGKPVSTPATAPSPTIRNSSLQTGMLSPANLERLSNVTVAEASEGSSATIMSIPFQSGDEWNVIQLEKESPQRWKDEDQALVRQVVDQLGLALQNAQLFQQTERQNTNLAVLNEMGRELATQLDLGQVVQTAYKFISQLMDTSSFFIALLNSDQETLTFPLVTVNGRRIEYPERKIGSGLTDYVLRTQKPQLLNGNVTAQMQALGIEFLPVGNSDPAVSWLGVPLIIGNLTLGAIVVQSTQTPYLYTEQSRDLLVAVASQAAISLQNAQLFFQTEEQKESLEVLNEMGRELTSLRSIPEIAESLHKYTSRLMDGKNFFLALHDPTANLMDLVNLIINNKKQASQSVSLDGITGWVFKNKQPLLMSREVDQKSAALGIERILLPGEDDDQALSWLGVPLLLGEQILGALVVQSLETEGLFKERERDLLIAIASQAAISIQNARLFDETQKRTQDLATLNDIVRAVSEQIELKQVLEVVYQEIKKLVPLDAFFVGLYDEKTQMVAFPLVIDEGIYYNEEPTPITPNNFTGQAIFSGKTIYSTLSDEEAEALTEKENDVAIGNTSKKSGSLLFIPLKLGQKTLGCLSIQSYSPSAYSSESITLLENVSNQISTAIQNATLFEETQRRNIELGIINELVRETSQLLEIDEICKTVYKYTSQLMDTTNFFIVLYDEKENLLRFPISYLDGKLADLPTRELGDGLSDYIVRHNEPIFLAANANEHLQDYCSDSTLLYDESPAKSWLGVPLSIGNRVLGAVVVQSTVQNNIFSEHHRDILVSVAGQVVIILENTRLYNQEQRRRNVADALSDMARIAGSSLDLNEIVIRLLSETPRLLKFRTAIIQLVGKEDRLEQVGAIRMDSEGMHVLEAPQHRTSAPVQDFPLLNELHEKREPIFIEDTLLDQRWQKTAETSDVRSWLGAPLVASNRVIGLLLLHDDQPNTYNEDSAILAQSIAAQVASSIFNTQLFKQSQDRARREQLLREITARVRGSTDPDSILRTVVREVGQAFGLQTFINIGSRTGSAEKAPAQISDQPAAPPAEVTPQPGGKAGRRKSNLQPPKAEGGK